MPVCASTKPCTYCVYGWMGIPYTHSVVTSGIFNSTKPSWGEDGIGFATGGGMYRSVTQINETHTVLELVPKRSRFEPSGAHNYTCFLPLVGGGELESKPVHISPISKLP